MRPTLTLLLAILSFTTWAQGGWSPMSDFPGDGRHHPITVANDQYGYVIAGQAGFAALDLDDVFRYDPETDSWQEMEPFPGGGRGYGYGVCGGNDAYVGFGSNNEGFPTDWWHLDMASGGWTALADFPGIGRNHPAMVLAGGKVMVGLGSNGGNLGDWWAYDIATDTWEIRAPFTAGNRHHPFYFGIDGIAYVGFGHGDTQDGNITIYRDFHAYDPVGDSWTQLGDFPGEARVAGTQFAKDGFGYVLSGDGDDHGPLDYGECWKYDPNNDLWAELEPHPGGARWAPGSFVLGCYVYLTGGLEGLTNTYHNDLWRLSLSEECGCTDPGAVNYSPSATTDDGSCCFVTGCMQETAINYNPEACAGDGSCIAPILGCTDSASEYFDPEANAEEALGGAVSAMQLGSGGFHYNDMWDMRFDVSEPTLLKSVDVLAETAFNLTVYIRDAAGQDLMEETFALAEGWNTLTLDLEVPNGTDFSIGINGANEGLFRNNAVPSGTFPIAVADRMEITSNTTDSPLDYYYYFYRWVVQSPCAPFVGVGESVLGPGHPVPNPTSGPFSIEGGVEGARVSITDPTGREVYAVEVGAEGLTLDLTGKPAGTYLIRMWTERGKVVRRIVVH